MKGEKFKNLGRFLPYYKKYWKMLLFDLFCALLSTAFSLIFPLIVREITNRSIYDTASLTTQWLLGLGGIYLLLVALEALAGYYMQAQGHIMGAMMETDMRKELFAHLQQLSFAYYSSTKIGQLMSRITTDLNDITEFAHHGPEELSISLIKITVAFFILASFNVTLTLIIFALMPLMIISTVHFNRKLKSAFRQFRQQVGEINAQTEDTLLGMRVVQSFANEEMENEKFGEGNIRFLNIKKKQYHSMAGFHSTNRFLRGLMNIVVVIVGAVFLAQGKISTGDYASYVLYINTLLMSVQQLVMFSEQFQRGTTGIDRFFEIMDAPLEIKDSKDAVKLKDVKGNIRFENVSFTYGSDSGDKKVLNGVNLNIDVGENIAVVGPSGSGKTTLCNLIPRFYDTSEGTVLVDGIDVKNVSLKSLRGNIGMVQQDVYLFSGTVYDNIAYGKPSASREEVIAAAKRAGAHSFIEELKDGYDTYVGERGVKLSGGQKQRISIARVFLKNPPILLLDEATSALDNESERLVQKSLEELAKGRTCLTIAHRLTTIRGADRIVVLTENGIEEMGTHDALIEQKGIYYNLHRMYSEKEKSA